MKIVLLALVAACGVLHAGQISVTLDFNISLEYLYASGEYSPLFTPQTITTVATFDDSTTSRTSDPHDVLISFGTPFLISPLTSTLPYGPGATTINPSQGTSQTLMTNYSFGSGDTGSYFQIQNNQTNQYGLLQSWVYGLAISFPAFSTIPPLANPSTFSGDDLETWLKGLEADHTSITLSEYSYNLDGTTGKYLGGVGYMGQGVITAVNPTPEPATAALAALGFGALMVFARRGARTPSSDPKMASSPRTLAKQG